MGSSRVALKVSPTLAVSESTPSVITTDTKVPDGTRTRFGAGGGATASALTSSGGGGTGAGIGDPTGEGNVTDFGSFEAVFAAGVALAFASAAGRGRDTGRVEVSLAGASRLGFAAGVAFGSSAGRDATGAGAGCCSATGAG